MTNNSSNQFRIKTKRMRAHSSLDFMELIQFKQKYKKQKKLKKFNKEKWKI